MASSIDFVEYVCEQISQVGEVNYKKMFGEYMIYLNGKPIFLVCDNTCFVKILDELFDLLKNSPKGFPYKGAKEHYILDIDDSETMKNVAVILEKITPLPKKKSK